MEIRSFHPKLELNRTFSKELWMSNKRKHSTIYIDSTIYIGPSLILPEHNPSRYPKQDSSNEPPRKLAVFTLAALNKCLHKSTPNLLSAKSRVIK